MRFGLPVADLGAPGTFYTLTPASPQSTMAPSSSSAPPAGAGLITVSVLAGAPRTDADEETPSPGAPPTQPLNRGLRMRTGGRGGSPGHRFIISSSSSDERLHFSGIGAFGSEEEEDPEPRVPVRSPSGSSSPSLDIVADPPAARSGAVAPGSSVVAFGSTATVVGEAAAGSSALGSPTALNGSTPHTPNGGRLLRRHAHLDCNGVDEDYDPSSDEGEGRRR